MTPEQCRQARLLLGMTLQQFSASANIPRPTLSFYERTGRLPVERVSLLRAKLEAAGANFTDQGVIVESAQLEHLSGQQCHEARLMLGWTVQHLSEAAGMDRRTVRSFEARGLHLSPRRDFHRASKVRAALEAAGVEFIQENGSGPGVRLRAAGGGDV